MNEALLVIVMAALWWAPTFMGLTDLQNRHGVRRVLVWKWTLILCIPVFGWWWYNRKGRAEVDADARRA